MNFKIKILKKKKNLFLLFFLNKIIIDFDINNENNIILFDKIKLNKFLKNVNLLDTTKTVFIFKEKKFKDNYNFIKENINELLFFYFNNSLYTKDFIEKINNLINFNFNFNTYLLIIYKNIVKSYLKLIFILKKK